MKSPKTPLLLLLATVHAASAAPTFFTDNFTNGSTLNSTNTPAPATNSTSYEIISSKSWSPAPTIAAGHLKFGIGATTSGSIEVQALFAANAVALVSNADF